MLSLLAGHCFNGLFEEKQSNKLGPNYKLRMVVNWQFLTIGGGWVVGCPGYLIVSAIIPLLFTGVGIHCSGQFIDWNFSSK